MESKKNKALFLDRDGIINEDVAYAYRPDQIKFLEPVFALCKAAVAKGYLVIVVTNQSGIARGYFSEEDVNSLHAWMAGEFLKRGIPITAFYYCPYHLKGSVEKYRMDSDLRKPRPGMVIQAALDYNIDISRSIMIGDKSSDRIQIPDLKCVIVKSQYTEDGEYDVDSLEEVASYLQ
jgi:D-glycero-D-manno-heptose 1,7-bisphosphate phosphatase